MSFEELWKNSSENDDDLSALIKPGLSKLRSKDPLNKLKRNILAGAILGLLISACYVYIMAKFPVWQVFVCIGIVFTFTVWASLQSLLLYKEISRTTPGNSLLQELESHYAKIKKWMNIQQQAALFIYPVSATGGFMIGGSLGAEKTISEVMQKPAMIIALLITLAILVPICYYFARWLNKKAFGKYAEQLKQNIDTLNLED
ncbi:MAG: hypothetical protein H7122_01600 [Chitinophagaceae bacterium]|nr:hypothetical protein [Chitinophagaceae bacterium]